MSDDYPLLLSSTSRIKLKVVFIFIVLTFLEEEREIGEIQRQFVVIWIFFREICFGYFCHVVTHLPKSGEKEGGQFTLCYSNDGRFVKAECSGFIVLVHHFEQGVLHTYVSGIQRLSLTFSYVSLEASPKLFHRRSTIKCTWTLFMNFYLWAHYTCTFNSW